MKHLLCLLVIIVVALTACDQGSEMMKPVIQEVMANDAPVVPTQEDAAIYAQYDVNQDGKVDNADLTLVSAALGQKQPTNPRLDIDGSGVVDASDIILVSKNYDDAAPGQEDAAVYAQYDVNQDGTVGNIDLMLVSEAIGQKNPDNPRLDVNRNGVVDGADLILIGNNIDLPTEEPSNQVSTGETAATPTTEYLLPTTPGPDWELGVYRMRVWTKAWQSGNEYVITSFSWAPSREFDDHGLVTIIIKPEIWAITLDNEDVIDWHPELTDEGVVPAFDEVSLEITRYIGETTDQDGRKTYTVWEYEGRAIANLSRPEILFEEYNP